MQQNDLSGVRRSRQGINPPAQNVGRSLGRGAGVGLACLVLFAGAACAGEQDGTANTTPNSTVAAGDGGEQMNEDEGGSESSVEPGDVTIAQLDQSYSAYISCLRPQLDGTSRVNFERYTGVAGEMWLPDGRDDADLVDSIARDCEQSSLMDQRLLAFASTYTLTAEQVDSISKEIVGCLRAANDAYADEFESQAPGSIDEMLDATSQIRYPQDAAAAEAELSCVNTALYGDAIEF